MNQNSMFKRVSQWLIAHSATLLIMVLFAALKGMAFWWYVILIIALVTVLMLYLPVIGLKQSAFYSRDVVVKHIEYFLLNIVWIGIASYVFLLVFKSESRPILLIALHVITLSLLLSFYPLMSFTSKTFTTKESKNYGEQEPKSKHKPEPIQEQEQLLL